MFATPCATSSILERCRPPIMPSATTAESSDSIAPSSAMVNAGPMRAGSWWSVRGGRRGAGSAALIAPKRLPIVSTGKCSSWTSAVVTISATKGLGMRSSRRGQATMMASAMTEITVAQGLIESKCAPNACHFSTNPAGTVPMRSPRKSLTWLEKMMSAIPLVNPIVTG